MLPRHSVGRSKWSRRAVSKSEVMNSSTFYLAIAMMTENRSVEAAVAHFKTVSARIRAFDARPFSDQRMHCIFCGTHQDTRFQGWHRFTMNDGEMENPSALLLRCRGNRELGNYGIVLGT